MKWKEPSNTSPILALPKIQKSNIINLDTIEISKPATQIKVTNQFLDYWESPPKDLHSKKELWQKLQIIGDALSTLAKQAHSPTSTQKTAPHDMVTLFDEGLEMILRIWIQKHYPHHKIIGEEGAKHPLSPGDIIWFIDPIDGTANFVKNSNRYTIHIGSIKDGLPYVSYVSIPKQNISYCDYQSSKKKLTLPKSTILCSEFFPHQTKKKERFNRLLKKLNATSIQNHSIGLSCLNLLEGKITAFYKNRIKLWDIMAPLCFLKFYQNHLWDINLYYTDRVTKEHIKTCPFSNTSSFIHHLNNVHKENCRAGLLTITPKSKPNILKAILEDFDIQ